MKLIGLLTIISLLIMGTQPDCDGENMYYVLEDSKLKQVQQQEAGRFYIKGYFEDKRFFATSQVLGDGILATDGTPGWYELSSQHFYSQQTAQAPISPYLVGYMTPQGFVPSKKDVY
jgi:hypothetical protein